MGNSDRIYSDGIFEAVFFGSPIGLIVFVFPNVILAKAIAEILL